MLSDDVIVWNTLYTNTTGWQHGHIKYIAPGLKTLMGQTSSGSAYNIYKSHDVKIYDLYTLAYDF